ncbi:MAG: hypothetical protein K2N22_04060, partial [Clostridia bacterium]|nr:hypothetical protein [Clostridia bacterium]
VEKSFYACEAITRKNTRLIKQGYDFAVLLPQYRKRFLHALRLVEMTKGAKNRTTLSDFT